MNEILSIFKELAQSNTINFVIMAVLLYIIIKNLNLGAAFEKSIDVVKNLIVKSEQEKEYGEKVLKKNRNLMDRLPQDLADMERTSESKTAAFKVQIEANTKSAIEDLGYSTDRVIAIEEKKVSNLLTQKTSLESVKRAKEQIIALLEKNPELHTDFIQQSLDELDKVTIK